MLFQPTRNTIAQLIIDKLTQSKTIMHEITLINKLTQSSIVTNHKERLYILVTHFAYSNKN